MGVAGSWLAAEWQLLRFRLQVGLGRRVNGSLWRHGRCVSRSCPEGARKPRDTVSDEQRCRDQWDHRREHGGAIVRPVNLSHEPDGRGDHHVVEVVLRKHRHREKHVDVKKPEHQRVAKGSHDGELRGRRAQLEE